MKRMYRFPPTFTQEKISKFFNDREKNLKKELKKYNKDNKFYFVILEKIEENKQESRKYEKH